MNRKKTDTAKCSGCKNSQQSGQAAGVNSQGVAYVNITPITPENITPITPPTSADPASDEASGQGGGAEAAQGKDDHKGGTRRCDVTMDMIRPHYLDARSRNGDQPPTTTELRVLLGNHGSFATISKYKRVLDAEYKKAHPKKEDAVLHDKAIKDLLNLLGERIIDFKLATAEKEIAELKQEIVRLSGLLIQTEDKYDKQCDLLTEQINQLTDELHQAAENNTKLQELLNTAISEKAALEKESSKSKDQLVSYKNIQMLLTLLQAKPDEVIELIKSRSQSEAEEEIELTDRKEGN